MSINSVPMNEADLATLHSALRHLGAIGKHPADALSRMTGRAVVVRTIGRAAAGEPVARATVRVLLSACRDVLGEEVKRAA